MPHPNTVIESHLISFANTLTRSQIEALGASGILAPLQFAKLIKTLQLVAGVKPTVSPEHDQVMELLALKPSQIEQVEILLNQLKIAHERIKWLEGEREQYMEQREFNLDTSKKE